MIEFLIMYVVIMVFISPVVLVIFAIRGIQKRFFSKNPADSIDSHSYGSQSSTDGGQTWTSQTWSSKYSTKPTANFSEGDLRVNLNKFYILGFGTFFMLHVACYAFFAYLSASNGALDNTLSVVCVFLAYTIVVVGTSFLVLGLAKTIVDISNSLRIHTIKSADYTLSNIDTYNDTYRAGVERIRSQAQNCQQMVFAPYKTFTFTHLIVCGLFAFGCISNMINESDIFRYFRDLQSSHIDINIAFGDGMTSAGFFTMALMTILMVHAVLLVLSFIVYLVRGSHADTSDIYTSDFAQMYSPPQIIPEQTARAAVVQSKGTRTNIDEADTVWARRRKKEIISWEISPSSNGTIQMKSGKKVTKRTLRIIMVFCVLMIIFSICTMDSDGMWMSIGICVPMLLMCIAGYNNTYEGKGTDPEDMDDYSGEDDFG